MYIASILSKINGSKCEVYKETILIVKTDYILDYIYSQKIDYHEVVIKIK